MSCASSSAEYAACEAQKAALLAHGAYVRTAAVNAGDGIVKVWFRNAAHVERVVMMTKERYDAVPLLEPATYARFFLAVREAVAVVSAQGETVAPAWERFQVMSEEVHEMLVGAAQCRNHLLAIVETAETFEGLTPYMSGEALEDVRLALDRLTRVGL